MGRVAVPKSWASAPSRTLGASSWDRTARASLAVHRTGGRGHGRPCRSQAARRKPASNGALWATSTAPRRNSSSEGRTAGSCGAPAVMADVMPVSATMPAGTLVPGSTSVSSSPRSSPPRILTAPISVMESVPAEPPVVSRSSTTNVTSRRGVPSSSNDSCGDGGDGRSGTAADGSGAPRQIPRSHGAPAGAGPVRSSRRGSSRRIRAGSELCATVYPRDVAPSGTAGRTQITCSDVTVRRHVRSARIGWARAVDRSVRGCRSRRLGPASRRGALPARRAGRRRRRRDARRRRPGCAAPPGALHPGQAGQAGRSSRSPRSWHRPRRSARR